MSWRTFALRRVMHRLHVGEDILRHLTTFQRLGAPMDVTPPREVVPLGVRTVLRAVRTGATTDITPEWVWPRWLEQQRDPTSASFTPRGHLPTVQNTTLRNWTLVGTPATTHEAVVDPSGLVTPAFDGWSVDWWVRDERGWRFPSRERPRQQLLGAAPAVSTALSLGDGDVEQQAWAVETVPGLVCMEIINHTAQPREVAVAVRPANPEGLAVIERLRIAADAVHIEGQPLITVDREADGVLASTYRHGDCAGHLQRSGAHQPPADAVCHAGLAQGVAVYTLGPGGSVRAAIPLGGRAGRPRWQMPWRRPLTAPAPEPARLPSATTVAADWTTRLRRGLQVEVPDARLQQAVDANRAALLTLHDPGDITAGPFTYHRFWFRDAAYQVAALDRWGFHDEATDVLRRYPDRQRRDGMFHSQWREWDATGAAIWTLAEHDRLTGDRELRAATLPAVLRGARWIVGMCADDAGTDPRARGLLPAGISAEHFGPFDYYYWDDFWAWRGLLDAAGLARRHGEPAAAHQAEQSAARLRAALLAAIGESAERAGEQVITAGPTRGVDAGMIGGLAACYPLGLLEATNPWIAHTAEVLRQRFTVGPAFYQGIAHTGLGTYLTLQLAFVELFAGDPRAWDRLSWLVHVATPTWTWPEAVHPALHGGCMGDGHHGWAAAELLSFVRMLLVREDREGLTLLSVLPPVWRGQRVRVDDAPTHHGRLSYELTWEDDQPRLRWELDRGGVRLTAPSLSPAWSTTEARGDVVLGR